MPEEPTTRTATRAAIVGAAARLLHDGGPAAVTTRGVAEDAGVQAPTIYRIFGDKDGLLEAVAEHVMAEFVAEKSVGMAAAVADDVDPLDDVRESWHRQVDFGLANPAVFRLLSDPDRVISSPAAGAGREVLAARVRRLAATGRLRVSESRAMALMQAAGVGTIQLLLATAPAERDEAVAEEMLDAVLARILRPAPDDAGHGFAHDPDGGGQDQLLAAVVSLRALAPGLDVLSPSERQLLADWLDRITAAVETGTVR